MPHLDPRLGRSLKPGVVAVCALLLAALPAVHAARLSQAESDPGLRSAALLTLGETRTLDQFDYIMTGKIRLLFFWTGADDVGGGYIRRSASQSDPDIRLIEVLFGSDPGKAPRGINRWGAATEAIGDGSNAVFGFMTETDPDSVEEAEAEMEARQAGGEHPFSAILSYVSRQDAVSRSIPLFADTDYSIHQFDEARSLIRDRLVGDGPFRRLDSSARRCGEARGFLQSVEQMIDRALALAETPVSLCYVYNARDYMLILEDREEVDSKAVTVDRKDGTRLETTYERLIRAKFETVNHESKRSSFELFLGRDRDLRGVPVQIVHQPNFWFKVELNLEEGSASDLAGTDRGSGADNRRN